ncbi:MAG: ABC transporter permease, partial [Acidimicrobiia bacterium]|nr:ABC transporter permease [Acidimicrobiia bacterium]
IVKEFRQVRRDKRTLAMMIVMPIVLLIVFGYAASFDVSDISTVVYGPAAEQVSDVLPDLFEVDVVDTDGGVDDAMDALRKADAVVAIVAEQGSPTVYIDGSQLFAARAASQAMALASQSISGLSVDVLYNPDLETSAVLVPGLGGLILLFIGMIITSLGVVKERQAGTLEQLAVMPLKPSDVFIGKIAPYFLVAFIDLAVVLGVGTVLFDVPFNGSVWTLGLGAILFLFVTLGMGVLVSSVSENQGQAIQLALMALLPQILLSGLIFPLSSMAAGVRWIGYLLPLTYFNKVALGVMLRDASVADLWFPLVVLVGMGIVIFGFAVIRFRRDLAASSRDKESKAA